MKYTNIREEELKAKVSQDYFWLYDCSKIIGNVDFCVCMPTSELTRGQAPLLACPLVETQSLLWAEAKKGDADIYESITQLILTIGKARTFDKHLPPPFLGCFDYKKIAFLPYSDIQDIFYQNDFNWNVTPSNHNTREFQLIYNKISQKQSPPFMEGWTPKTDEVVIQFDYEKDDHELKKFIKNNFADRKFGITKTRIDKNNFITIRERKGSFFTPQIWVELSQKYLADVLGEDWQDEYYVWDCAAGTGNLLAGLTNKNNIWASTLDKQDVDVMCDRIENGANLWKQQVFQFDFLNDEFLPVSKGGKLPNELFGIISDENKRKKLVIYINPPYVEAMNKRDSKKGKIDVNKTNIYTKNLEKLGKASREIYVQFLTRIYTEIPDCKIGEFSTQKAIIAPNFKDFRKFFLAKLMKCFVMPANTFDNVNGKFPIGFKIWDTQFGKHFNNVIVDVYDAKGIYFGTKTYQDGLACKYINDWLKNYIDNKKSNEIGAICCIGNDFQHNNYVNINHSTQLKGVGNAKGIAKFAITVTNLIETSVYFAVRKVIPATWLNDRDQFLYPNNKWKKDIEFQNDCLAYTLFNNNIQPKHGVNHWIPFTENEVNSKYKFESHFMIGFISGKIIQNGYSNLFEQEEDKLCIKREFSSEAKSVFDAGRELWKYYHNQNFENERDGYNVNASLYDIREYFQGRNEKGKMNNKSTDEKYNELIENLRFTLQILAQKIEPKIYEYEFLK